MREFSNKILTGITDYESFENLVFKLRESPHDQLFDFLFPLAISSRSSRVNGIASSLLVALEPKSTRPCAELLYEIGNSQWDVSIKEIPFYLTVQFGKWNLLDEIELFKQKYHNESDIIKRVESIAYWLRAPIESLCADFHYFEWRDMIEEQSPPQ